MKRYRVKPGARVSLDDFDPDDTSLFKGSKKEAIAACAKIEGHLADLQEVLYAEHKRKCSSFSREWIPPARTAQCATSWPASIRPASASSPSRNDERRARSRFPVARAPSDAGSGEIVVFNRSHYEDVLVVRVHNLVSESVWSKRYDQINEFERILAESGTVVLKFFLHISKAEQKKRLQERIEDPTKRWKFQHGDIEERRLWRQYEKAYEDALSKTSTKFAPWIIVPANAKWYRNYIVRGRHRRCAGAVEDEIPEPDLSKEVIV